MFLDAICPALPSLGENPRTGRRSWSYRSTDSNPCLTLLAAQLQCSTLHWNSQSITVEGELNHFTAIKKPNGDIEINLQYVSFTICIPTTGQQKNKNKNHLDRIHKNPLTSKVKASKLVSIGSTWLSRDTPPRRADC